MAPPLIFLFFVIIVLAIVAGGALLAIRTGLWVKQTDPDTPMEGDEPLVGREAERADRFDKRPEHVAVEDPSRQRFIGS
jgi:hypothetical protein